MSTVKHFIIESVKKTDLDEFLWREFERAGYGGVDVTKTPLGTNVVIYAIRPGIIIGRGGLTIKNLAQVLEEKFGLPNPQISVAEIEVPELNAHVMASRIAAALKRGVHFRRAGFWALNQIMEAGALGAEIVISGKLRTERARSEKFRAGYMPKSGDPALKYVRRAVVHVQLKPGIFGIKVSIMPSGVEFPDKVELIEIISEGASEVLESSKPQIDEESGDASESEEVGEAGE
ncbi:MAG: 30S ribosomal protein S3 [Nitrososphaerota archaeon]|nr:30S ribosomal protein S3 [Candidatus Bathyarchaeota archaeon]MDW8048273.1 30S ribosomal protein S3 [Nitrososphaerota archaeon]